MQPVPGGARSQMKTVTEVDSIDATCNLCNPGKIRLAVLEGQAGSFNSYCPNMSQLFPLHM